MCPYMPAQIMCMKLDLVNLDSFFHVGSPTGQCFWALGEFLLLILELETSRDFIVCNRTKNSQLWECLNGSYLFNELIKSTYLLGRHIGETIRTDDLPGKREMWKEIRVF